MTNNRYVLAHATDIRDALAMASIKARSNQNVEIFQFPYARYKTATAFKGRDPLEYSFLLRSPDRAMVDEAAAALMSAPRGGRFYPGRSDRFVEIDLAHVSQTEDILALSSAGDADYIYQAEAEVYARHPFLLSDSYQWGDISAIGDFVEFTNNGRIPAKLTRFYLQSLWDGSHTLGTPNLLITESDKLTPIASIELATEMHTDEMMDIDILSGIMYQRYVDTLTDTNKWQRDISDSHATVSWSAGVLTLSGSGAYISYNFESPFTINSAPIFRARINTTSEPNSHIMYQTETLDEWSEGPAIQNDVWAEYPLTGAVGKKNFTLIFYLSGAATMQIFGIDIDVQRHIGEDDIPEIAPGASAAWTLIASEGTSFNAAGRFHNLYLK